MRSAGAREHGSTGAREEHGSTGAQKHTGAHRSTGAREHISTQEDGRTGSAIEEQ
jgi:hypothetical protein